MSDKKISKKKARKLKAISASKKEYPEAEGALEFFLGWVAMPALALIGMFFAVPLIYAFFQIFIIQRMEHSDLSYFEYLLGVIQGLF